MAARSNSARRQALAAVAAAVLAIFSFATRAAADPDPRIVGGSPADIGQVPWQVAVADSQAASPGSQNGFQRQFCGGSLVAPTLVVTAAHCVYEDGPVACDLLGGFDIPAGDLAVFTGRTVLSSSQGQEIPVAELYYFESDRHAEAQSSGDGNGLYDCNTTQWDVALLLLQSPSTSQAIQIAGADEAPLWAPGQQALISGWGSISDGGTYPDTVRSAQVQIVGDATCAADYAPQGIAIDAQTMVCAGVPGGGVDTCSGDSGGPIAVAAEIGASLGYRLVGDTSFGVGCGEAGFPGVYGRIAADPMRSALATAAEQIAGASIVGSGARVVGPPETTIKKHPRKTVRTRKRRARTKFTFTAGEPATFSCKLDRKPARACSSPFAAKVKRGRHTFTVAATDQLAAADQTPSTFKWRVKRKRH
jgi:secreted trypsin-like serine protease